MAYDQLTADLIRENESMKKDAERWRIIESHWHSADVRNNKDGSFKSMTITFNASQVSDETNKERLRRGFDGVMTQLVTK